MDNVTSDVVGALWDERTAAEAELLRSSRTLSVFVPKKMSEKGRSGGGDE